MARLNEPPIANQPSAETIEAVKRRFLRQNRELAKTNSTQSIRIRSLENDCSRLLAENLALREQVLNLHNTVESRPAFDHIDAVKLQLETKIQELGGLVAGLAQMKNGREKDTGRRKSQMLAKRRSGEERQWRSGLGLQEVENAMLPTIAEDKSYPRRTMGADELQQVLEGPESQSPDIGPPPVSRFESEDPIGFDPAPVAEEPQEETAEDGEPALSVNLETRKKRRESGPKLSIRRVSVFESPEEAEDTTAKPLRTGAKRKFSVQEDEDANQPKGDAFRFSRRNASESDVLNEGSKPLSLERPPVLLAKPVNTDPVVSSPKKQRSSLQEKSEKPTKPEKPASKARSRPRLNITRNATPELANLPMPDPVPTADIVLDSLPPKTPAVAAVISPPTTEPSTQRPENKDTPPPGDLSSADQTGQAGRPGRRARPQVSYKEPSLNVKMRRPDAKLADAVVERRTSVEPQNVPSTIVKREANGEIAWKPVSAVSGAAVDEEAEAGSPLRQKVDRREQDSKTSPASTDPEERSTTSKAISALITETSTAKRKMATSTTTAVTELHAAKAQDPPVPADTIVVKQEVQDKDNLAVFDFTDSPPAEATSNQRARELAKAARSARRHSAMPAPGASSVSEERRPEKEKTEGALPSLHKRTGSGGVKSTSTMSLARSSSTNGVSRSTSSARTASVKDKKPAGAGGLPGSASTNDIKAKGDGAEDVKVRDRETSALRAERAASRRKSMML
ncbi:shugoshin family protein [Stemphylium lycopersici]|uniref:Shugoshin family protein n=1 Tax=Stemphylium lycopersici TaxID=183478 RepID=A0A364NC43_STELY|nr:shugoshin family protein [Stemphylium lycopersici]